MGILCVSALSPYNMASSAGPEPAREITMGFESMENVIRLTLAWVIDRSFTPVAQQVVPSHDLAHACCRLEAVLSACSSTRFLGWICTTQILHKISQRQVRIQMIYLIYLICATCETLPSATQISGVLGVGVAVRT